LKVLAKIDDSSFPASITVFWCFARETNRDRTVSIQHSGKYLNIFGTMSMSEAEGAWINVEA